MHRFWGYAIEPILARANPRVIVEIGSQYGTNTKNILDFCRVHGATLHVIDPSPEFDVESWQNEHGDRLVVHLARSLDALPTIGPADVVMIDGDHNWYTVFNELRTIRSSAEQSSREFPITLLHDIEWPYGRRDGYYRPADIPSEHRKTFRRLGVEPGSSNLRSYGGLNDHLNNSVIEGGPHNGVLTAVEDFLNSEDTDLKFYSISGFHGLGVLIPGRFERENRPLMALVRSLRGNSYTRTHMNELESSRIRAEIRASENHWKLQVINSKVAERECAKVKEELNAKLAEAHRQLQGVEDTWSLKLKTANQEHEERESRLRLEMEVAAQERDQLKARLNESLEKPLGSERAGSVAPSEQGDELAEATTRADVVVCVHDALEHVQRCLESLLRHATADQRLILVDDGSGAETRGYLARFAQEHPGCVLISNDAAQGYTKAANQGLRASDAPFVVLLNSDTVVTAHWLERLLECCQSDPRIGIVGPLSNAASWQSIPEQYDASGDWAVNRLPTGWIPDQVAEVVAAASARRFPRVPFVNGFCLLIRRSVIDAIGYLDEASFPDGYGEENDYCLRAAAAGFELAVADHAYVYHAKSQSFSHERRRVLSRAGHAVLTRKHGQRRVEELIEALRADPALPEIRGRIAEHLRQQGGLSTVEQPDAFSVLFVLPAKGGGGGSHSVVQEVGGLKELGVKAHIAVEARFRTEFEQNYPELADSGDLFFYDSVDEITSYAGAFDIVVATIFHSANLVKLIVDKHPSVLPAYYVQDYEPWFLTEGSYYWKMARDSYSVLPHAVLFAKTEWLCDQVRTEHGVDVHKVSPSLDQELYFPSFARRQDEGPVRVTAMIRPSTVYRGADRTMRVLQRLKRDHGDRVAIHIFGCSDAEIAAHGLERDFDFTNEGVLLREQVADLFRRSDVFVDFSHWQAFGRSGLEAMACGCAVVVPARGGVGEYGVDRENSLIVDTSREGDCYAAVSELVRDDALRRSLRRAGVQKAAEYSIRRAAVSEATLFAAKLSEWARSARSAESAPRPEPERQ
jgi:GT2 family glycosyltransferase